MKKSLFTLALLMAAGCKAYKIDPPPGFAEVSSDSTGARMIGGEHVGLHLRVFANVPGGTLTFWSQDLVRKLGERRYVLTRQTAVKSGNGVAGTRFDFDYVNPDGDAKFYSVVVFATNEHLFALQMAGDAEIADRFRTQLEQAIEDTKVRGCRPWGGRPCRGPQPAPLSTPPLPAEEEPAAEDEAEPLPVAEDEAKPKSDAKPKDEAKPKTETTP